MTTADIDPLPTTAEPVPEAVLRIAALLHNHGTLTSKMKEVLRRTPDGRRVYGRWHFKNRQFVCARDQFKQVWQLTQNPLDLFEALHAELCHISSVLHKDATVSAMQFLRMRQAYNCVITELHDCAPYVPQAAAGLLWLTFKLREPITRETFFAGIAAAALGFTDQFKPQHSEFLRRFAPSTAVFPLLSSDYINELLRELVVSYFDGSLYLTQKEMAILVNVRRELLQTGSCTDQRLLNDLREASIFVEPTDYNQAVTRLMGKNSPLHLTTGNIVSNHNITNKILTAVFTQPM